MVSYLFMEAKKLNQLAPGICVEHLSLSGFLG